MKFCATLPVSNHQTYYDMTRKQAQKRLEKLGFVFPKDCDPKLNGSRCLYGTKEAESYDTGRNHFKPYFRCVFVAIRHSTPSVYVTSNIVGDYRGYRCRTWCGQHSLANIFGHGATLADAIGNFVKNYESNTYNRTAGVGAGSNADVQKRATDPVAGRPRKGNRSKSRNPKISPRRAKT